MKYTASQPHTESQKRKKKKRILIVDDEPDIIFTLKLGLENSGFFEVETFTDPQLALSNFKPDYYDFLLIDIGMPITNGYEFYDKIRNIDSKVKFRFMTSYDVNYQALREQFPTIEFECYTKPFEINELVKKINVELD